jgi:hypothetical protein
MVLSDERQEVIRMKGERVCGTTAFKSAERFAGAV